MKNEKKVLVFRLRDLIHSLSQGEKHVFSKFISKSGKTSEKVERNYLILFKHLAGRKSLDENSIRKSTGLSGKELANAARHLRKIIFESLVNSEPGNLSNLRIAQKAIEKGFLRYGKNILTGELTAAFKNQDPDHLNLILNEVRKVSRLNRVEFKLDTISPYLASFPADYIEFLQIKLAIEEIRNNLLKGPKAWKDILVKISKEMDTRKSKYLFPPFELERLRLEVLFNIIGSNKPDALKAQTAIVSLIERGQGKVTLEEKIQESRMLLSFLVDAGRTEDALNLLGDIASIEVPAHLEDLILEIWVVNSLVLSATVGDFEMGKRGRKDLQDFSERLKPQWKFLAFHCASILCIYQQQWSECNEWQNRIGRLNKKDRRNREWVSNLVKALCHFELGYGGEGRKQLSKLSIEDGTYAQFVGQTFLEYYQASFNGNNTDLILQRAKGEYSRLFEAGEIGAEHNYFDVQIWIESKLKSTPMQTLLIGRNSGGLFYTSKVS